MTPPVNTPRMRPALLRLGESILGLLSAAVAVVALWGGFVSWVLGLGVGLYGHHYKTGYALLVYGASAYAVSRYLHRLSAWLMKRAVTDKVDALRVEAWRRAGLTADSPPSS